MSTPTEPAASEAGALPSDQTALESPSTAGVPQRAWSYAFLVWFVTFGYAFVRYVVLGPVPLDQVPLFILNKSVSVAAIVLFALSLALHQRGSKPTRAIARGFGLAGTWMIFGHVLASIALLAMRPFEAFYIEPGRLTVRAQFALLFGVIGVCALAWQHIHATHKNARWVRRIIVALGVAHVAAFGCLGWLTPENWHGSLPPITLLAAIAGSVGLFIGLRARRDTSMR